MTDKQIDRYNELLVKFLRDEDFMELLGLLSQVYVSSTIEARQSGLVFLENPYEKLIYDLEMRERILKEG